MKDKTGKQEIVAGSYIVYATTLGRSAGLKFGKVLEVQTKNREFLYKKDGVVTAYRVVGVDDNWTHRPAEINNPGTLLYENRIVVIPFEMLPDYAQKLLKDL